MKRFALVGVDALDNKARIANDVVKFTDKTSYFSVTKILGGVKLVTPKGCYNLKKHTQQNYYHGTCEGHKVQISLKKIVGEIRFW